MVGHSANKFKYQNAKRKMTEENSKMASLATNFRIWSFIV